MQRRFVWVFLVGWVLSQHTALGVRRAAQVSFLNLAFSTNAGGQRAFALIYDRENWSNYQLFVNHDLRVNSFVFSGFSYGRSTAILSELAWLRLFGDVGAGFSTAGPFVRMGLTLPLAGVFRVESSVMVILSNSFRPTIWSYPLWLGFSVQV